jgi:hypothetical protein
MGRPAMTQAERIDAERYAREFADTIKQAQGRGRRCMIPESWDDMTHAQVRHAHLCLKALGVKENPHHTGYYEPAFAPDFQRKMDSLINVPEADPSQPVLRCLGHSYDPILPQLDITAPKDDVSIEVDARRHVVYVHVGPVTVLRICRTGQVTVTQVGANADATG